MPAKVSERASIVNKKYDLTVYKKLNHNDKKIIIIIKAVTIHCVECAVNEVKAYSILFQSARN